MPPNNQFPQPLNQQQFNQPLQGQQPQFGDIGVQGGQQGGGNNQPPPPDPRNWWRRFWDNHWQGAGKYGWYGAKANELTPDFIGQPLQNLKEGAQNAAIGQPGGFLQLENYTPEQIQALNMLLGNGFKGLMDPYEGWQGQEDYARKQFNEQIIPDILSQFNHATGGARLSSGGFAQQLGASGSGLAAMLQANRAQYGQNNRNFALNQIQTGLTPQFQYQQVAPQPGFAQHVLPKATEVAINAGANYLTGGGAGAVKGINNLRGNNG